MNRVQNPYSPGAGAPPPALIGRQQPLEDMDVALERRLIGRSANGIMLTGRHGVGKTVLLAEFASRAVGFGYVAEHIEAGDGVDFAREVASAVRRVLLQLEARQRRSMARAQVRRALSVLKAFSVRLPQGAEFTLEVAPVHNPKSGARRRTDLLSCGAAVFGAAVVSQDHDTHSRRTAPPAHGARHGAPRHHASGRGPRGRGRVGPAAGASSLFGPVAAGRRSFGTSRWWTASRWPSWGLPVRR